MKRSFLVALTASLLIPIAPRSMASDSLLFMGAGGEPASNPSTIFDNTFIGLNNYLMNSSWKYDISFNGGHSYSESLRDQFFRGASSKDNFTEKSYDKLLSKYKDDIKSGKIKPGEKLLIIIDTHGADKETGSSELTHKIAVNTRDLKSSETVSLDELKVLTKLAKEKGIKLGIVDFSCHSGHSLSLADENTCVITATGPKHFGYSSFSDNFVKEMKTGGSLEDVFLRTRAKEKYASYPMISTPEAKNIYNDFYPALIPYLYYYDQNPSQEKMTKYLIEAANDPQCPRDAQMSELQKKIELLQKTALKNIPEVETIKKLFTEYKAQQDQYIKFLKASNSKDLLKTERVWGISNAGRYNYTYGQTLTWREIIETDFETSIEKLENVLKYPDTPEADAKNKAKLGFYKDGLEKQKKLLRKNPSLVKYKEEFKNYKDFLDESRLMANKIAQNERSLFSSLYDELKKDSKESNPCRDFSI
jgi:hypothetical protein